MRHLKHCHNVGEPAMAGISESRVDLLIRPARFNLTNILLSKLSLYGNLVNPVEILVTALKRTKFA